MFPDLATKPRAATSHRRTRIAAGVGLIATLATTDPSGVVSFQSPVKQVSLVELYTSEGCSSCPPAELWLSEQKHAPGLWTEFVPVAFHVDYWDDLGWPDRWASRAFSNRQRAYARLWRSARIYTPGFVLNGREWHGWESSRNVAPRAARASGVLAVESSDRKRWRIRFTPTATEGRYEAHAALLASGLVSEVKGGENRGRRLTHDFTVLELAQAPLADAAGPRVEPGSSGHGARSPTPSVGLERRGALQGEIAFGQSNPVGDSRLAVAVWVTRAGQLEPLQSVGGWLPSGR